MIEPNQRTIQQTEVVWFFYFWDTSYISVYNMDGSLTNNKNEHEKKYFYSIILHVIAGDIRPKAQYSLHFF